MPLASQEAYPKAIFAVNLPTLHSFRRSREMRGNATPSEGVGDVYHSNMHRRAISTNLLRGALCFSIA